MKQNLPVEFDESIDPDLGLEVKPEVIEQLLAIRQSKSQNPEGVTSTPQPLVIYRSEKFRPRT